MSLIVRDPTGARVPVNRCISRPFGRLTISQTCQQCSILLKRSEQNAIATSPTMIASSSQRYKAYLAPQSQFASPAPRRVLIPCRPRKAPCPYNIHTIFRNLQHPPDGRVSDVLKAASSIAASVTVASRAVRPELMFVSRRRGTTGAFVCSAESEAEVERACRVIQSAWLCRCGSQSLERSVATADFSNCRLSRRAFLDEATAASSVPGDAAPSIQLSMPPHRIRAMLQLRAGLMRPSPPVAAV